MHSYKIKKHKEKLKKGREKTDNEQKDFHCATVNTSLEVINMCVVPVMVSHKPSNGIFKTFDMLDTGSHVTFAMKNLLSDLGVQGRKTSITVKTMNGEVPKSSEVLEDLEKAQTSNGNTERVWVKLCYTYAQEDLPMDSNKVAAINKIRMWDYLGKIKAEINANGNIEVTLLIGANCVKTLVPREIIASNCGGPYALGTLLGCTIVGLIYNLISLRY